MFATMAVILLMLWTLGMVSGANLGWWVHLFLMMALISTVLAVASARSGRALR